MVGTDISAGMIEYANKKGHDIIIYSTLIYKGTRTDFLQHKSYISVKKSKINYLEVSEDY